MNLVLALEQLGYTNITDFEVQWDGTNHIIDVWNHTDPQPDQSALDAAWSAWETANPGPSLDDIKITAKREIDDMAGQARLRFITEVPGQALTYQEKAEEAADYVAAGYPVDTSNYPFIQAEIDATGLTKEEAADGILANKSAWIVWGAEIEKNRIGGKTQVEAAADIAAVDTIVANIQVLLDAIE